MDAHTAPALVALTLLLPATPGCGDDGRPGTAGTDTGYVDTDMSGMTSTEPTGEATTGGSTGGTDTEGSTSDSTDTEGSTSGEWPDGPTLYPEDRTLSPITAHVADRLREIAAYGPGLDDRVFAKVGASSTVSPHFLRCFDGELDDIDLGGRDELWATIDHHSEPLPGDDQTPFGRETLAAKVGWPAFKVLAGDPSPLQQEVDAIAPRYAVVMFGTNDIGWADLHGYAEDMLDLSDALTDQGVIPVLTTIMPRADDPDAAAAVPRYNAAVRAVAQARQIPLVDYHRELAALDGYGLGADGIHPSVYTPAGVPKSCLFTAEGLTHGYTVRNLITLETLDRLRQVMVDGATALDQPLPPLVGEGSEEAPIEIPGLLFTDARDTARGGFSRIDVYTGCAAAQDESGPEFLYRLELAEAQTLRMLVFDRGDVDIDLHLLDDTASADGCIERNDKEIVRALDPGTYYLSLDTYISGDTPTAGEFLLVVMREP